ncbi:MAG: carbohydrate porin [Planctomycetes bacterium]|nr:carbohydrate porin [Planctomycetota bacterium]
MNNSPCKISSFYTQHSTFKLQCIIYYLTKPIPFVRYSLSDGDSTNIQQLLSTGIWFIDTFGRENDVAGIGLAWGAPVNKSLWDQYTMESFYRFQVKKHLQITPGIQLIANPSNDPDSDFKAVFQIRARITF